MNILIIHPNDRTTDFLKSIYAPLLTLSEVKESGYNVTVITGSKTKDEVRSLIEEADQIIVLGHGSSYGLLAMGKFDTKSIYIIDDTMVAALGNKPNIYIWCNADRFVNRYHLKGFFSGMFISEVQEATYERVYGIDQEMVTESNDLFAEMMGNWIWDYSKHSLQSLDELYKIIAIKYSIYGELNKVVNYNAKRIYFKN